MTSIHTSSPARHHSLDALRVIAFGLLIFYHVGMGYVSWGWHVKSDYAGPEGEGVMMLLNPWRLSLLFFISGVASAYLLHKKGWLVFTWSRGWRLFVPLFVAMHSVVAPQTYFQLRQAGLIEAGFWPFFVDYIIGPEVKGITTPTWNHLWYVTYLWVFCLILGALAGITRGLNGLIERLSGHPLPNPRWTQARPWWVLVGPIVPLLVIRFTLVPYFETTHALWGDWANLANMATVFLIGVYVARQTGFWASVDRLRWGLSLGVPILMVILSIAWAHWDWVAEQPVLLEIARVGRVVYIWTAILILLAWARVWFTQPSAFIRYMNSRIFALYIFHQTITVALIYMFAARDLIPNKPLEVSLSVVGTLLGSWALAELVYRIKPLRPFFGLKS